MRTILIELEFLLYALGDRRGHERQAFGVEAALGVYVDSLTSQSVQELGQLHVHAQLHAQLRFAHARRATYLRYRAERNTSCLYYLLKTHIHFVNFPHYHLSFDES